MPENDDQGPPRPLTLEGLDRVVLGAIDRSMIRDAEPLRRLRAGYQLARTVKGLVSAFGEWRQKA